MAQPEYGFRNIVIPMNAPINQQEQDSARALPIDGKFQKIEVGQGNRTIKQDERGLWMGSDDPTTAPFFVDMDGNISIRASALTNGTAIRFYDTAGNLVIFIGIEDE